jgi:hypothetical protein
MNLICFQRRELWRRPRVASRRNSAPDALKIIISRIQFREFSELESSSLLTPSSTPPPSATVPCTSSFDRDLTCTKNEPRRNRNDRSSPPLPQIHSQAKQHSTGAATASSSSSRAGRDALGQSAEKTAASELVCTRLLLGQGDTSCHKPPNALVRISSQRRVRALLLL